MRHRVMRHRCAIAHAAGAGAGVVGAAAGIGPFFYDVLVPIGLVSERDIAVLLVLLFIAGLVTGTAGAIGLGAAVGCYDDV